MLDNIISIVNRQSCISACDVNSQNPNASVAWTKRAHLITNLFTINIHPQSSIRNSQLACIVHNLFIVHSMPGAALQFWIRAATASRRNPGGTLRSGARSLRPTVRPTWRALRSMPPMYVQAHHQHHCHRPSMCVRWCAMSPMSSLTHLHRLHVADCETERQPTATDASRDN